MNGVRTTSVAGELPQARPGTASLYRRAKAAFGRLYGRSVSALFRTLEPLPLFRGQRRRLFESLEYTALDVELEGVGRGLHDLRIAWVSDVHAGFYLSDRELERVAERLRELAPDVLCLGGDLVANHFHELDHFEPLLALDPPLGTYAVPGNHEHFYFTDEGGTMHEYVAFLEARGVRVLVNRGVRLERGGDSLWLCGIDDLDDGRPDLRRALEGRREGEPVVLLSHHPDTFHDSAEQGIGLQLSGHTHGGQINFGGWSPVTHSKHGFRAGLFEHERSSLYVGRGVGCSLLPIRIGVPPEVPIVRLSAGGDG